MKRTADDEIRRTLREVRRGIVRRRTMRRISGLALLLFFLVGSAASSEERDLRLDLRSAPFSLLEVRDGVRIEMPGFDYVKHPGRPMLPERELLVLVPPGAKVVSLEVQHLTSRRLPGRIKIAPTPPLLRLSTSPQGLESVKNEMAEWEQDYLAAYSLDRAYPEETIRIVGSGSLRKYSYVRIAFRPFTYHASSGRLVHHDEARVRITYARLGPTGEEARHTEQVLADSIADDRATKLFVNYEEMKHEYESGRGVEQASRGTPEHHDYVIITTPGLMGAITASAFPGWKSSLGFDVRTVLITDPEITEQPGVDLAERVRNFLRANYGPWGIEYVLLVGDYVDVPMRHCYPDPANHLHDPSDPGTGPGSVPTDAYYADLSFPDAESWDLDGDGFHGEWGEDNPDFLAEVSVGRIPTSVVSRVTYALDKLVRVEQDTGGWKRNALHAGAMLFFKNQDDSGIPLRDGAVFVDETEKHFMEEWPVTRYAEQEGLIPSVFPWPALTLESFILDWNSGTYGFVNWAGHGWPDGVARTIWSWDDGDGVPETDGSDGINSVDFISDGVALEDDFPSIVCAVSCNVGYPEPNPYGNMGVNLLTQPQMGGAAAVVSSSRYAAVSFDWPALPGGAESLCYEFNRYAIAGPGGPRRLGDALYESKFFAHFNFGWDHGYEYRNLYNYNLYGDPSMDWRGAGEQVANLLRSTEATQLDPVTPPLDEVLPLDPIEDLHIPDFVGGDADPDPASECPLVFYAIDSPVRIWLGKTPSGEVRIVF